MFAALHAKSLWQKDLTAPVESHITFNIVTALKATERRDIKWKSKFASPSFQPSIIMILTPKKLCEEGFLSSYPLDLLMSLVISKIELLIANAKYLGHVSGSSKIVFLGSSRALINNAIWHGSTLFPTPGSYGCSAHGLPPPH